MGNLGFYNFIYLSFIAGFGNISLAMRPCHFVSLPLVTLSILTTSPEET